MAQRSVTKQLAQARVSGTSATSIYSPSAGTRARITSIIICNTTGSAVDMRLFIDEDGTTYDETTALYFDHSVAANDTLIIPENNMDMGMWLHDSAGNIAFRTATTNAFTVTVYGEEFTN